jgi:hypothetical protein
MTGTGKIRSQSKLGDRPPGGAPKRPPALGLFRVSKHAKAKQPKREDGEESANPSPAIGRR